MTPTNKSIIMDAQGGVHMLNNVKKYREDIGLSQSDLAIKSQVSRATISDLENNKEVNLTTKVLLKIAKALNKTVTDVFFIK